MSTGALTQNGLQNAIDALANLAVSTPYQFGLYVNNYIITPLSTWSDITEATFTGYSRMNVAGYLPPVWDTGGDDYTLQFTPPSFLYTGGSTSQLVYGFFMVAPTNILIWGELLYVNGQPLSPSMPIISFLPELNISND